MSKLVAAWAFSLASTCPRRGANSRCESCCPCTSTRGGSIHEVERSDPGLAEHRQRQDSSIMQLGRDVKKDVEACHQLSMRSYYPVVGARPGARPVFVHARDKHAGRLRVLAATGRRGKGRTFFVGLNEMWLWRRVFGSLHYGRFWSNVVNHLAGRPIRPPDGSETVATALRCVDAQRDPTHGRYPPLEASATRCSTSATVTSSTSNSPATHRANRSWCCTGAPVVGRAPRCASTSTPTSTASWRSISAVAARARRSPTSQPTRLAPGR